MRESVFAHIRLGFKGERMGDLEIQNDGFITNSNFGDCHSHSTLAKHISVKLKYWVKILGKI